MSHSRLGLPLRLLIALLGLVLLGLPAPAPAVGTAEDCPPLGNALGAAPGLIAGQAWAECADATAHDPASTLDVGLPGDDPAALLTTGTAAHAAPGADKPPTGTSFGVPASHEFASDVSSYRIDVAVPEGHNCLAFDYAVGSDELGVAPNAQDGFVASIGSNDWTVVPDGPGAVPLLSAPHAFASFTTNVTTAAMASANNTSYAGVTEPLHAEVGVPPGQSTIYLSVYDAGYAGHPSDPAGDTAVWVDNLTTFADPQGCASPDNTLPQAEDDGSVANPLPVTTDVATPLVVTENDYDQDGNGLTASIVENPGHGTVSCEPSPIDPIQQACWYASDPGYEGPDSFGYRVSDGRGGFDTATVYVAASDVDLRTVQILGASGQPDVTVSAQVQWPNGIGSPDVSTRLLVGPDEAGLAEVGTNQTTDEFGFVVFAPYQTPSTGTYLFRVTLVDEPSVHDDLSRVVDHDPPTNAVIAGPTSVQVGVEATWSVTMTRANGDEVVSFQGTCFFDNVPMPIPCSTDDGTAEFTVALEQPGDVNLMFEGAGLSDMCFIHVQDDPVVSPADCSTPPPSPLEVLTLERVGSGPVTVGDAVQFAVTATRANNTPFQGQLLCGLAPATAVDCGGTSPGWFSTDSAGHASLCWVPTETGQVEFGVADGPPPNPGNLASLVLQVGESDGTDVPCEDDGGGGTTTPVTSLALDGPTGGNIDQPVHLDVTANPGAEGPLACTVTHDDIDETITSCDGILDGAGAVEFTPTIPGDYLVSVSSGEITADPFTYHAVDPTPGSSPETITLQRTTTAPMIVGHAVRFAVTARRADHTAYQGPLLCGLAPSTAVDCGGPFQGRFTTDEYGNATLCWVPDSAGPVTFGVADNAPDAPGAHTAALALQIGPPDGVTVPCTGTGEPVSLLSLSGPREGNIGVQVSLDVAANLGAQGPLACTVSRNGTAVTVPTCDDVVNGVSRLRFTPTAPGDHLITVSSGAVTSATFTYRTIDPNAPSMTGLTIGLSAGSVTWPASPTVTGTLSTKNVAPALVAVELWAGSNPAALTRVVTVNPSNGGGLSATPPTPTVATYYQWRVPAFGVSSPLARVDVAPRATIRARKVSGRDRVTGIVTPTRSGALLRLQRKVGKGAWRTVAQTRTVGSSYTFKVRSVRGLRQFRVVVVPDSGRLGTTSGIVRLR